MKIISYQKPIPFAKKFFGFTLLLGGLAALLTGSLFGLIFIAIGLGLNLAEGSEIDLASKTFRSTKSLFGFKMGNWKPIPEFEYVSVFKTKESQTVRVVTAETTQTYAIIHVNLFYNRNKHITFYKTDNKKDAFDVAEHFKLALGIDVLDATESEKKWL